MIRLPGRQTDTARYFYQGHVYYWDGRNDGRILRCKKRNALGCSAVAVVNSIDDLGTVHTEGNHLEDADMLILLREEFKSEVMNLARTTWQDLKAIFDETKIKEK